MIPEPPFFAGPRLDLRIASGTASRSPSCSGCSGISRATRKPHSARTYKVSLVDGLAGNIGLAQEPRRRTFAQNRPVIPHVACRPAASTLRTAHRHQGGRTVRIYQLHQAVTTNCVSAEQQA